MEYDNISKVADERVAQAIASKKIYDQLYPPPDEPDYDDADSKQTKRYLWTLYMAAVVFSAVHTIPGLLERVPDMVLISAISLNLKHIAGAAAFVMFEIGLMTIPYILFRYLTDSAEAGKEARIFMRKSLRATVGLVVVVLIMLNIYTTLRTSETSTAPNTQNVILASTANVVTHDSNTLENAMWSIVAISPVFIAVVSGMGLALLKSHQQNKEQVLKAGYTRQLKEHEKEFRHWDAIQQRTNKGAYSATKQTTSDYSHQPMATNSLLVDSSQLVDTTRRDRNASSAILEHLEQYPEDATANVQELAKRLQMKPSTVSKYQRAFRAKKQLSAENIEEHER